MDSIDQNNTASAPDEDLPSYWSSVGVAAGIFGVITFVIFLMMQYAMISAGSLFSPAMLIGLAGCLAGAFGGMLATWHYANRFNVPIKMGRGALIGFLTGAGIAVVSSVLGNTWEIIDPDLTQQMIDSTVTALEALALPEQDKQQMIDATVQSMRNQTLMGEIISGIFMNGILNLITGMIGAKIFGKNEPELI